VEDGEATQENPKIWNLKSLLGLNSRCFSGGDGFANHNDVELMLVNRVGVNDRFASGRDGLGM